MALDQPRWPAGAPEDEHHHGQGGRWIGALDAAMGAVGTATRYFHGSVTEDLEEVLPATRHGRRPTFPHDTDRAYAYATSGEDAESNAWHYAEQAHAAGDAGTLPRVYEVEPIDPSDVEEDPFYNDQGRPRSIMDGDVRSRTGWRVIRELPWPEHFGDPEDWR